LDLLLFFFTLVQLLSLGSLDLLLFFFTLVQLLLICTRERQQKDVGLSSNGQRLFYVVMMVALLVRGVFFVCESFVLQSTLDISDTTRSIWTHSGDILFFFAYFMLFLLWMNFYYIMNESFDREQSQSRNVVVSLICCLCTILLPAFVILEIVGSFLSWELEKVNSLVSTGFATLEIILIIGFVYYGLSLAVSVHKGGRAVNAQISRIKKVSGVVAVTSICYGAKAVTIYYFLEEGEDFFSNGYFLHTSAYVMLAYFVAFEVLPSILILYLLTHLPTWREKDFERYSTMLLNDYEEMDEQDNELIQ